MSREKESQNVQLRVGGGGRGPVLLTGATGFIGFEVARQLAAAGHRPRLLVRRPERAALVRSLPAELVSGDLTRPASLERAVEGVDAVIHLGARAAFESYRRLRPTIVDGTLALGRAAAAAGVRHFVFASSLLVYDGAHGLIDRRTPARPVIDYGRAKIDAEESLAEVCAASGMDLAVVRLPHVYGARALLFEAAHRGLVVSIGRGRQAFSHLHVEDAARALIAVERSRWTGTAPVADERPASWAELIAVLRLHYPRFRHLRIPAPLARCGAHLAAPLLALRRRPSMVTPDTVTGWTLPLAVAPGTLWGELGVEPLHPTIEKGIPAALDDRVAFRWRHPLLDPARY